MRAMCLMLASARNLIPGVKQMMGKIEVERNAGELGQHFTGATVGIIGMGNIGFQIAKRAHFGFGCKILYHNRSRKEYDCDVKGHSDGSPFSNHFEHFSRNLLFEFKRYDPSVRFFGCNLQSDRGNRKYCKVNLVSIQIEVENVIYDP